MDRSELESSRAWRDIRQQFSATGRAAIVQRGLTQEIEALVIEAYQSSLAAVRSAPAAIFAAGDFGRCEPFPYCEIDIVIVQESSARANLNQSAAQFVRLLWEKGVRIKQRACTIVECLELLRQDTEFTVKMLDRRLLAGDSAFASEVDGNLASVFAKDGQQFAERLIALTRARHGKYQETPSHREPDVKESPGGLRDLRFITALERFRPHEVKPTPQLEKPAACLSSVRCFLNYRAREDRHIFDLAAQEAYVEEFAQGAVRHAWMREYFRHARLVFTEARRVLESCETSTSSLLEAFRESQSRFSNNEFSVINGRFYLRRPGDLVVDGETIFRLLEFLARHGIPPAPETERRLEAAKGAVAAFCEQPRPLWPAIRTILSLPHAARAFRVLQNTGLLSAIFPEWADIEGMATPDFDHPYTADEHTLMGIERICDLRESSDGARRRFSELLSEIEDQSVLLFALLFHELGEGPTDRSRMALKLAREASARIGMPAPDQDMVDFLIEQQTSLSDVIRGRDLDDPATVHLLSEQVGTLERLRMLTVLTYADLAATFSENMLAWRLERLWQTYIATQRELTRELETDRIQDLPASLSESAEFVKGFPMRYLRAHAAEEIHMHTRLYELSQEQGAAVQLAQVQGAYKLTVVALDRPALFASFAGAISSFGLDIVKAEAFSNSKGVILDRFIFADPKRTLQLNPPEAERLQDLIRRLALGKTEARRLFRTGLQQQPKKRAMAPQVRFDSEACETATLVEIVTEDRLGLLYSLATVFARNACDIDVVLIDTKGHRAIDFFYVAQNGMKLSPQLQADLKEQLLRSCSEDQ
ncbi:MAG: hypothetical protein JO108_25490 [Acidobacteriaceae bacterium]|nr:hypothetical protein [Acidobacteriaceae bacterium]